MLGRFFCRSSPSVLFSRNFSSKIFVKGVSFSSTEETLTRAFSQCGEVLKVDVLMDKVKSRPKGLAYVTFSSEKEANQALLELNGKMVDGRVIILDRTDAVKQYGRPEPAAGSS